MLEGMGMLSADAPIVEAEGDSDHPQNDQVIRGREGSQTTDGLVEGVSSPRELPSSAMQEHEPESGKDPEAVGACTGVHGATAEDKLESKETTLIERVVRHALRT